MLNPNHTEPVLPERYRFYDQKKRIKYSNPFPHPEPHLTTKCKLKIFILDPNVEG